MSDLPQKRSADEIKSESIKRSKKNDDEGTAAEVSSHSLSNEGGESVKQPNSDLTSKPPPPMAEIAESAEITDPLSPLESVLKQPNSDMTSKPPSAMAETAQSAEKSDLVSQPESVVKQPNSDLAGTTEWDYFSNPVYNPDAVPDFSKPPPSDLFTPLSKPWSPAPDPDSLDKYYIPELGIPPHLLFVNNRSTSYCIGCGKRTDVKHAIEHSATKMPSVKPFTGLFRSPSCKHCAPHPCEGHTLDTLMSPEFED